MAAFSSHLGAFSSHLCRVPTIQFQFISISRVHTIQLQAIVSRVHTIQRSFMQEPMWSCAIPRPKVVQSVPCTWCALEYQLHLGGYKQRTSLLNSGILDSTCVPSREEEEDRGEGHPTCEACKPYMHVFFKYYATASKALGCGWHLARPQVLLGFSRVRRLTVHVLYQQSSFVSWFLIYQQIQ